MRWIIDRAQVAVDKLPDGQRVLVIQDVENPGIHIIIPMSVAAARQIGMDLASGIAIATELPH